MDTQSKARMERWMRSQILMADEERGRCIKFLLRHTAGGRQGAEVVGIKVPKKMESAEQWVNEAANDIEIRVTEDAEGIGGSGVQTYVLLPFFESRADKPFGRFTIREASMSVEDEETDSEAPTKTGMLSQAMRHTEAAVRMSLGSMGQIMTTLKNANAKQSELIEKLVEEKMENIAIMERLRSEESARRIAERKAETDEKMKAEMLDKASALIPVIVNRIAGKNLLPGKTTPIEGLVHSLIGSISPEQIGALQQVLKPEQMLTVVELLQATQATETPALTNGNGSANPQ